MRFDQDMSPTTRLTHVLDREPAVLRDNTRQDASAHFGQLACWPKAAGMRSKDIADQVWTGICSKDPCLAHLLNGNRGP